MKKITIAPNAKQEAFFNAKSRYVAYGGARGGGKSWAMRIKLSLLAIKYDGINILLLRRTLGELRENHILPLLSLLDGIAVYRDSAKEFNFPNGSRLKLGYCDSENDVLQYQGQSYEVIGMEEATHFTFFQFQCLTECNRINGKMELPFEPRMYLTCNPGGVGNDWVKRLFVDRIYHENETASDYTYIKSLIYDNKYLMEKNPQYAKTLESLPEIRRRSMLYGDWDAFEGAYFPEFRRDKHSCSSFEIPDSWPRFRSLDYGLDMTACYWYAIAADNRVYCYRELYEPNLILSEAAKRIISMTPKNEYIRYTAASPDLWNRRQDSGKSGVEIMIDSGLRGLIRADNSRISGWRCLREYLDLSDGLPRLLIFNCCENLLRTLPALRFDNNIKEDIADSPHELTHAPESLRYGLMSRKVNQTIKRGKNFKSSLFSFPEYKRGAEDDFDDFINL